MLEIENFAPFSILKPGCNVAGETPESKNFFIGKMVLMVNNAVKITMNFEKSKYLFHKNVILTLK